MTIAECGAGASVPARKMPLDIARKYLGTREATGRNDGPLIALFLREAEEGLAAKNLAWCAAFACHCIWEAGFKLPGHFWRDGLRNVEKLFDAFERCGALVQIEDARPGDLVEWPSRGRSDRGDGEHVDFLELRSGLVWTLLGGNVGNAVDRHTKSIALVQPRRIARWPKE